MERDLQADITSVNDALEFWRRADSISVKILQEKVTKVDIAKDSFLLIRAIVQKQEVAFHFNGYETVNKMLENKPPGYDAILESLSSLIGGVVPSVDYYQKNLQDIETEYRMFMRDNQTWSWLRYVNFAASIEKDYDFYRNDPRYKGWVAYHLRKQHALMTRLSVYRTHACNLLIAIQEKREKKQMIYKTLTGLIKPKERILEKCLGKRKLMDENGSLQLSEKERGYSLSSLVTNDSNDTVKVYRAMSDMIYKKSQLSIAPNSLKVFEHPQKVTLYFFRKDSCLGFTSHAKYNQLITIK